jgi:hypothetical protein
MPAQGEDKYKNSVKKNVIMKGSLKRLDKVSPNKTSNGKNEFANPIKEGDELMIDVL